MTKKARLSEELLRNRKFMHCPSFEGAMDESDQAQGITHPPHAKIAKGDLIELSSFETKEESSPVLRDSYTELLDVRRSKRAYFDVTLTQEQLALMLWSAVGIQEFRGANDAASLRPSPSGGARHPFNLYVVVRDVEGLEPGLYLYAPLEHVGEKRVSLSYLGPIDGDYTARITDMLAGQRWAAKAPAIVMVTCDPYRAEWRYGTAAHRVMLIDLGHLGQNLMLSATAMGLGSCCMAAFEQKLCDDLLGIDGVEEYTVYAVSFGKARD
jgi:SagB-type dehydrogenase family enzyme